ncbi:MAG TPA: helix-turn-helix domain-containing protein [Oculatellaceae cyanobacterium]
MARPTTINDDLLLSTAREVFLEKGLRATTAEISERAGVSQGILFKRFKTKQALFRAAMNAEEQPNCPLPLDLMQHVGQHTVQENLQTLGAMLIRKYYAIIPSMMMDWSNTRQEPQPPREGVTEGDSLSGPERSVKGLRNVAAYLAEEAKLGRIKENNYEILAQTFIGACWHYAFLQVMMGAWQKQPISQEQYIQEVLNTLWTGIGPNKN